MTRPASGDCAGASRPAQHSIATARRHREFTDTHNLMTVFQVRSESNVHPALLDCASFSCGRAGRPLRSAASPKCVLKTMTRRDPPSPTQSGRTLRPRRSAILSHEHFLIRWSQLNFCPAAVRAVTVLTDEGNVHISSVDDVRDFSGIGLAPRPVTSYNSDRGGA
jgi:hypothetical protein